MKIPIVIVLLCLTVASCAATNEDLFVAAQISKLQQEYDSAIAGVNKESKNRADLERKAFVRLLDSCSELERQMQVQYLLRHPATNSAPTFENLLVQEFIIRLTESNHLQSIPPLLATHCPDYIGLAPLEYWLAWEKGPRAISLMKSAYFLAGTNYSSHVLVNCFERAFPTLRPGDMSDKEFVITCEKWIEENQASCTLNYDYHAINMPTGQPLPNPSLFLISEGENKTNSGK